MKNKAIVSVGVFSAISFLLQLIVPFKVGGFLDVEFSDIPAMLISFANGPFAGVLVELFKNILHMSISTTGFVGEFANFIINGLFVFTLGMIYKRNKTKKNAVISLFFATAVLVISAFFINLFVMLPLYMGGADIKERITICLMTISPFNLFKGIIISSITLIIYKKISRLLK